MQFRNVNIIAAICAAVFCCLPTVASDFQTADADTNWRQERQSIERLLADELRPIATWCRQNNLPEQAEQTVGWYLNRDVQRQYIFLPPDNSRQPPQDPKQKLWFDKLDAALIKHAERVFELAKRAASAGAGGIAYQFLNEVVYLNPDHEQVRSILGHRKTDTGWQVESDRLKVKTATRPHPTMNWQPKTYLLVSTPHFKIASQADEETTRLLAEKLERWHGVWRQVFFEFWNRPSNVTRWIEGKGKARRPTKKFDVVFFANRDQYISQLGDWVKGIQLSTGYYNDSRSASYFFASDDVKIHDTWRHELTHQLFQESIRSTSSPFNDQFLWLGEGIAMYMESLADFGPYVTLGGFESRRLQYARIRKFREGIHVPLADFAKMGLKEFQQRTDIAQLYSQSAGLTHLLMDDDSGNFQRALTEFLKLLYQGKLKPDSFEKIIGLSYPRLDEQYKNFLAVQTNEVEQFLSQPDRRTELALPDASLSEPAFASIGNCRNLKWLDLTANAVTGAQIQLLTNCDLLSQLFLTNCSVDEQTLQSLAELEGLIELDLSGSSVTDQQLASLKSAKHLKDLRLTKTNISDLGLKHVAALRELEALDVSDTRVTASGIDWLQSKRPQLKINQQ